MVIILLQVHLDHLSMRNLSNNLSNRVLWYDGSISLTPDEINNFLLNGNSITDKIFVTELTEEINQYNKLNPDQKIDIKQNMDDFDTSWNIPEKYKLLNLSDFVYDKLIEEYSKNNLTKDDINKRINRIDQELELYTKYNIISLLKTLIYIVDVFEEKNVVWGTGRGSSCSSYILYLIGLHDVDSVKYDLDVNEFFREKE